MRITVTGSFDSEGAMTMSRALARFGKTELTLFSAEGRTIPSTALYTVQTIRGAADVERVLAESTGVHEVHVEAEHA